MHSELSEHLGWVCPYCQGLTLRLVARQMPIIDSIGFVEDKVLCSC